MVEVFTVLNNVLAVVTLFFLVKTYLVLTRGKCSSKKNLSGKTVLITGGTRGMGYHTAWDLARREARVIIVSENKDEGILARDKIITETGNKNIVYGYIDLSSLQSVRDFAKEFLKSEDRLDILINNAGTSAQGRVKTKDGLIPDLQINYFGHFLLTNLLLELMKKSEAARIVNVSSILAMCSIGFDPKNINSCKWAFWHEFVAYSNSKLLMVHATREMARRLKGTNIIVNSLHPGDAYTKLVSTRLQNIVIGHLARAVLRTPAESASNIIHLAVCESVEGKTGKYFAECKESWLWVDLSSEISQQVWDQSVALVHLKPEEMHFNAPDKILNNNEK